MLAGLIGTTAHVYLDDIVVQGTDLPKHIENSEQVFERLRGAKLTLKLEKCEFFKAEVEYLGHVISADGLTSTLKGRSYKISTCS